MTDANLILGRLLPQYFPKIFGPQENESLDIEATRKQFTELTETINLSQKDRAQMSVEKVALGFVRVANEAMCRPIRALTQARGLDTSKHVLVCFGGAGGQHACAIARELGISKVLIHKYAGILSAYGMALADVVQELQEPCGLGLSSANEDNLKQILSSLQRRCRFTLENQGFKEIELESYLHLRYEGTDGALMCTPSKKSSIGTKWLDAYQESFLERYRTEYGFILENRRIVVDDVRVRGLGKTSASPVNKIAEAKNHQPKPEASTSIHFEQGLLNAPIYLAENLLYKHRVNGPALIIDKLSTIVLEPDCELEVTEYGDLIVHVHSKSSKQSEIDEKLDAIQLSIFSHRFMSIAEQMGR